MKTATQPKKAEPMKTCQECHMSLPANRPVFHPHVHCVLYKAYRRDPATILEQSGYVRSGTTPFG